MRGLSPGVSPILPQRPRWIAYAFATIAVLSVAAIKWSLYRWIQEDAPFLMFLAAIMAGAWFGGAGPGLFATGLAVVLSNLYMHPVGEFDVSDNRVLVRMSLFACEGVFVSILCAHLHRARDSVERAASQARDLEKQILEISDAEQRRIGHDLHDGLGQQLTGIAFIAKRLEHRLSAAGSNDTEGARQLSELIREAVAWTHDLSHALVPAALEKEGLASALQELSANASRLFDVPCRFELSDRADAQAGGNANSGAGGLRDVTTTVHLYRIAQEAVTNAIKHGRAGDVLIRMIVLPDGIAITIRGDGRHLPHSETSSATIDKPATAAAGSGRLGRMIMEYRARMIGAALKFDDDRDGGTTVSCTYLQPRVETNDANQLPLPNGKAQYA